MLLSMFLIISQSGVAGSLDIPKSNVKLERVKKTNKKNLKKEKSNIAYQPYLEIGGTRFFKGSSKSAAGADLFIPLWQTDDSVIFTDARLYDRSGKPFEGNIHFGYRKLSPETQRMFGVYGSFDRNRSEFGNYYNQLTFGLEAWFNKFFIGGNFYQPIGVSSKRSYFNENIKVEDADLSKNIIMTVGKKYEKSAQGVDTQIGYEFTKSLTGYVGGYYFKASDTNTVFGPKASLTYDWSLDNGKRIFGLFDKFGLETGIQRDQVRGTLGYLNAKLRIGLMAEKNAKLQGVARHMIDLVRRDVDIVTVETKETVDVVKEKLGIARDADQLLNHIKDGQVKYVSIEGEVEFEEGRLSEINKDKLLDTKFIYGDKLTVSSIEGTKSVDLDLAEGSIRLSGTNHSEEGSFGSYVRQGSEGSSEEAAREVEPEAPAPGGKDEYDARGAREQYEAAEGDKNNSVEEDVASDANGGFFSMVNNVVETVSGLFGS